MPIILISENERNHFEMHGVTFYYRRLSAVEYQELYEKCTDRRRATTNWARLNLERIRLSALGWEGDILDLHGNPAPFSREKLNDLPEDVRNEWIARLEGGDPIHENEERQKNYAPQSTPG